MAYRTIKISWLPKRKQDWSIFTAARQEAGQLWSDLVEYHHGIRSACEKWPTKPELYKWAQGRYPHLHSQSVQQIVADFIEAIQSTIELRKARPEARYPWRKPKYGTVIFTNQAARIRDGFLVLPCGQAGALRVRWPKGLVMPGRMMEARLRFGEVDIVCQVPDEPRPHLQTIGIDLGVNTLIAAVGEHEALLISGREMKATVQWRNKVLASISSKQSRKSKGSRRWKRLQRRKRRMLAKARRKTLDICHKATHRVSTFFGASKAYVGRPFNDAARRLGPRWAQTVSQACNHILIQQLDYKLAGAIEVEEHYSSQTCPVCGERRKCRREYRCGKCGFRAPRDVVGGFNIRSIGMDGEMAPGRMPPRDIRWVHPLVKYPG